MKKTVEEYLEVIFPATEEQLSFFQHVFGDPCKRLLDIGCASGNQVIALCKKGYIVTGIDINEHCIFRARENRKKEHVEADFIIGDIKNLSNKVNEIFKGIYCIGNVLPHLHDLKDVKQALQEMYTLLETDGHIIIQIVNYERQDFVFPVIEKDNLRFLHRQKGAHFHIQIESLEGFSLYEHTFELLPIKRKELILLMEAVGFKQLRIFSDYSKGSYNPATSSALIVVGEK
ncbi:MAG: class I SAM-dependent methyltransferase [Bacillaceae bacterium]